jgi:hypothetical protein
MKRTGGVNAIAGGQIHFGGVQLVFDAHQCEQNYTLLYQQTDHAIMGGSQA